MFLFKWKKVNISNYFLIAHSVFLSSVLLFYLNLSLHCCVPRSHGPRAGRGQNRLVMPCAPVLRGWNVTNGRGEEQLVAA